jgi:putative mRNA 3-end processing factor
LLYVSGNTDLYATQMTLGLTELLLTDEISLSGELLPFEENELVKMMKKGHPVQIGDEIELNKDFLIRFIDAGHIPGSMSALFETEGKRVLVTGDINTIETRLLQGAKFDVTSLDTIIIEATYALQDHPDRKDTERDFVDSIKEILESDQAKVLIPAFAVARSQEILCILEKYGVEYPVTIDGMVRAASKVILHNPSFIRDYPLLSKALEKAIWVRGKKDKRRALSNSGIVVASAGMLEGGAAIGYLDAFSQDPKNGVFLVSFQIPGTNGRTLIETGTYISNSGEKRKAKSKVKFFDFSSHCGKTELWEILKGLKSSAKVYVVHGEPEACTSLAGRIKDELGLEATAPRVGDSYEI